MAGLVINGIKFRHGQVTWDDAYGVNDSPLPDLSKVMEGKSYMGSKITSVGMITRLGKYILVVTKISTERGLYDYTLIPFTRTKITYTK